MNSQIPSLKALPQVKSRLRYVLIILLVEKIVQHIFVTVCFAYNFFGIRSTVAVDYNYLLYSGAVVVVLFAIALWSVIKNIRWGLNLVMGLAVFDIVSEFVAMGPVLITINVSFIVAIVLLVLCYWYQRSLRFKPQPAD
jgi:hypothetical protein